MSHQAAIRPACRLSRFFKGYDLAVDSEQTISTHALHEVKQHNMLFLNEAKCI